MGFVRTDHAVLGRRIQVLSDTPRTDEARDVARQLRRAGSSVGANCRAMKRAKSPKDFASKASIVIEEADESGFWLELLVGVEIVRQSAVRELTEEASELVAIFTASQKTTRARLKKQPKAGAANGRGMKRREFSVRVPD
jgi:four helix bundle protein